MITGTKNSPELAVHVARIGNHYHDVAHVRALMAQEARFFAFSVDVAFGLKSGLGTLVSLTALTYAFMTAPAHIAIAMRKGDITAEVLEFIAEVEIQLLARAEAKDQAMTADEAESTGPAQLDFSVNITPANFSGLNPGAGHGGFSFTNEGNIAQIDSTGKISWSGNIGLGQIGQSHFSSGKAAMDAIANLFSGRTDNAPAPTAPPDEPSEPGSDTGGPGPW